MGNKKRWVIKKEKDDNVILTIEVDRKKYEDKKKEIIWRYPLEIDDYKIEPEDKGEEKDEELYFYEGLEYTFIVHVDNERDKEMVEFYIENERIDRQEHTKEQEAIFRYKWHNWIGNSKIRIKRTEYNVLEFNAFIIPTKMDFLLDYMRLVEDIKRDIYNLAYYFYSKTHINLEIKDERDPKIAFLEKLDRERKKVFRNLFMIERNPSRKIVNVEKRVDIGRAKGNNPFLVKYLNRTEWIKVENNNARNLNIVKKTNGYIPAKIYDIKKEISYDTVPNRFLLYFFNFLKRNIDVILKGREEKIEKNRLFQMAKRVLRVINHYKKSDFLKDVKPLKDFNISSLSLFTDRKYSEIYEVYQILKRNLILDISGLYEYGLYPIDRLYEIWAFLKIVNNLKNMGFEITGQNLIEGIRKNRVSVDLKNGIKITLKSPIDSQEVDVWLQKSITTSEDKYGLKSASHRVIPDIFIAVKDNNRYRFYVLDMKYRVDVLKERNKEINRELYGEEKEEEEDIGIKIMGDKLPNFAIDDIHKYRDAIVKDENDKKKKDNKKDNENDGYSYRVVEKGIAIFPGLVEDKEYKDKIRDMNKYGIDIKGWQPRKAKKEIVEFLKEILKDIKCNENSIKISKDDDEKKVKENTFKVWMCEIKLSKNGEDIIPEEYNSDDYIKLFNKYINSHPIILKAIAKKYNKKDNLYNEMMMRAILSEYDENIKPIEKLKKEEIDGSKDIALINFEGSHKDNDKAYIPSYSWYKENKREEILKKYKKKAVKKDDKEDKPKMIFFFQDKKEGYKSEFDDIKKAINGKIEIKDFKYINLWGLQKAGISDIVHIGGHYNPWKGEVNEKIILEDILKTNVLALKPLVVLMLCDTAKTTWREDFLSLVTTFLACGAGAVIGTEEDITDCEAKLFSYLFYKKIAEKQNEPAFKLFKETIEEIKKIKIENDKIRTGEGEIIECNNKIEDKEIHKKFLYFGDPEWKLLEDF